MPENLFIRLTDNPLVVTTVVLNSEGHLVRPAATEPLESVAPLADGRRTVVLVSGQDIVTTLATVPKASAARLRQMLPFSLEDNFAADIETLQFAAGSWQDSGELAVSVVAREELESWLAILDAAEIAPAAIYAATDGLPDTPNTLNFVLEGSTIMGRRPDHAAFVLEGFSLLEVMELLRAEHEDTSDLQHVVIYADQEALQLRHAEISGLQADVQSINVKESPDGCLLRLASTLVFRPGTNLLQGDFAPKSDFGPLLRPWYAAASLLLGLVVLGLLAQTVEYFKLRSIDQSLTELATGICTTSFSSGQLSTCRSEVARRLAESGQQSSGGNESFLSTLTVIAENISADGQIGALSYRNRTLDLELTLASVGEMDALNQVIAGTGRFEVNPQTMTPEDAGVKGRIQIVESAQ